MQCTVAGKRLAAETIAEFLPADRILERLSAVDSAERIDAWTAWRLQN